MATPNSLTSVAVLLLAFLIPAPSLARQAASEAEAPPSIEDRTGSMERMEGFVPLYWEERTGKLWMEIARWDEELLHYTSLPAGLGQNDLGLNRGDLGGSHVVRFRRVGPKVFMEEPNYRFRATSDAAMERRSVEDGFPTSVLWGFTVAAETGDRVLVDATAFFLSDWHGVERSLEPGQGNWQFDASRSAVHTYALRGDGQEPLRPVPAAEQQAALDALMRTLSPSELTIPRSVLATLPPRPFGYDPNSELFRRHTGLVFDAVAPGEAAADATLQFLFDPERAARMVQQKALSPSLPGLSDVIDRVRQATFGVTPGDEYEAEVGRAVERAFIETLMGLAQGASMGQVRAVAEYGLEDLAAWMAASRDGAGAEDRAHFRMLEGEIARFLERAHEPVEVPASPPVPPGSPIGTTIPGWMDTGRVTGAGAARWIDFSCRWQGRVFG